jgi:PAS domain S-box-containing protein
MFNRLLIENSRSKWQLVALLSAFSFLVIGAGYFYYRFEARTMRNAKLNELKAVGELKTKEISNWYSNELYKAEIISQNIFLTESIEKWINNRQPADKETLKILLASFNREHDYESIILTNTKGDILLSSNDSLLHIDSTLAGCIHQSVESGSVVSTDLYKCQDIQRIHIDFVSAISDKNNNPLAVICYRMDPARYLFPLIQSWPNASKTSETLLLRKEGDSVLFLNELRHRKNTALQLKIPLTQIETPAVKAVSGYTGVFDGTDYRGNDVVAYISALPGTRWTMVTKIDKQELFNDLYKRSGYHLMLTSLILLLLLTAFAFLFSERQRRTYRTLWRTQEEFRTTLYSIGDCVITTDRKGKIQHINPIAEKLTGWKEEEAHGMQLEKVFRIINEHTREAAECPVNRVLREGLIVGLANHTLLIAKDGKEIPISDSGAPIKNKNGELIGVVLVFRDQTFERFTTNRLLSEMKKSQQYLDVAGVIMVAIDIQGNISMINKKGCLLLGYNESEVTGKNWFETAIPEKERNQVSEVFQRIISGDITPVEYYENSIVNRHGEIRIVAWHNALLYDDNGKISGTLSSGEDITDRKLTEEALAKEKYLFDSLIETIPDNIYFKDTKSRFIEINKNMAMAFGLNDPKEAIGKTDHDFFDKEHADQAFQDEQRIIESGVPIIGKEEKEVWPDGHTTWALTTKVPLREESGKIMGIMGISREITEHKLAEEALRDSEEIFRNFMEYSPVYVFFKDENIRAIKLSKNYEQMLGKPLNELLGKTMDELFPSDIAKRMVEDDKSILNEGKLVVADEELNGRFYTTIKYPIRIDNNTRYLAGFTIDITEKKKAEEILIRQKLEIEKQNREYAALNAEYLSLNEELRTSNEELAAARDRAMESDQLKSAFLANMSHEIRTPMNAIIGFSDLLNNPDLPTAKQQQFTRTIRQRSYDLLALINDILDISKIEAGQMTLTEESGNLEELIADVYNTFKTVWCVSGKSEVKLKYKNHLSARENRIITDRGRLRQILSNLIGNAFKFTTEGSITIGCHMGKNQMLEFSVKDTGIGITPDKQSIIFDRFRQADEIYSRQFGGTGLGLSISKGLVELMGGKIWVESEPGKGSDFCFAIPYKPDARNHETFVENKSAVYQWKKLKLLLVEDDVSNTYYLKEALNETGINIVPVTLGKEAIDLIRNKKTFDLVLLDLRLPDIEGFNVVKQIKKFQPKLPVIIQTAYASDSYKKRSMKVGCADYLTKPIRKDDLLDAIGRCLEKNK